MGLAPQKDVKMNVVIDMLARAASRATDVADSVESRLASVTTSHTCPKNPEGAQGEDGWPALHQQLREGIQSIERSMCRIEDTLERLEL